MIEFHCEHCNMKVNAPDADGGQQAKCPHCHGVNYIPMAEGDLDEIPLTPLDEAEERRRRQSYAEDLQIQRSLSNERSAPGEPGRRRPRSFDSERSKPKPAPAPVARTDLSDKQINSMVVQFIVSMAGGRLGEADGIAAQLAPHRDRVLAVLSEITSNSGTANAYGLPTLPKPVLLGFAKQLQNKLR